jgi:hypothetical protein
MELRRTLKADVRSDGQEIPCILLNKIVYCRVDKNLGRPEVVGFIQHTYSLFNVHLNIIRHLCLGLPSGLFRFYD